MFHRRNAASSARELMSLGSTQSRTSSWQIVWGKGIFLACVGLLLLLGFQRDYLSTSTTIAISATMKVEDEADDADDRSIHAILPRLLKLILLSDVADSKHHNTNSYHSSHRLIDLGAGVRDDDPTFPFLDKGWSGLLVDGDPLQEAKMEERFPNRQDIVKKISYITADTIPTLLHQGGFIKEAGSSVVVDDIDILKIDIDSFDCFVMHTVLQHIRPKLIVMEVNVKFPPHIRFAMFPGFENDQQQIEFDSQKRGHVYGCSLAYQVLDLMRPHGYDLVYVDWNNAVYLDASSGPIDLLSTIGSRRTFRKQESRSSPKWIREWYEMGYWNRPDRDKVFGFNKEIQHWNTLNTKDILLEMQGLYDDRSHARHHVLIGDVTDPQLYHTCFDNEGKLSSSDLDVGGGEKDRIDKCSMFKNVELVNG